MKNLLFALSLLLSLNISATNYYFKNGGSDGAAGTSDGTAWATITKFNSFFSSLSPGDSLLFKAGDTFTGTLTPSRSGSTGSPIIIGRYGTGADPIISGGTTLSSWTSLGGSLYEASLTTVPRVVVIDGVQIAPGRFPNTGWITIEDYTDDNIITNADVSTYSASYVGGTVIIRNNRTVISRNVITAKSGDNLTFTPTYSGVDVNFGFFLEGSPALDIQNEWWYNTSNSKLRVYSASTPSSVIASSTSQLLVIAGYDYINVSNLDFRYSEDDCMDLSDCNNINVTYCSFTFSGKTAFTMGGTTNHNITFDHNTISYINDDAIHLYGGDNDALSIQYNTFTNIGSLRGQGGNYFGTYAGIVMEGSACSNSIVAYNNLYNIGGMGITGGGTGSRIRYNLIRNSLMYLDDIGAIYMQESTGHDKRCTQNIVDTVGQFANEGAPSGGGQAMGIYSDGHNKYWQIDSNVITNCHFGNGIYMDDGDSINIHNNLVYNNDQGCAIDYLSSDIDITNLTFKKNILYQTSGDGYSFLPQNAGAGPSISTWGAIDSNHYVRQGQTKVVYSWDGVGSAADYTIAEWAALYGKDTHTQGAVAGDTGSNDTLMYNATNSTVNISNGRKYKDIYGNIYDGLVSLTPYRGILLFDIGAATSQGNLNFIQRGRRLIN